MVSDDFKVYIFFISIILIVLLIFYFGLRVAFGIDALKGFDSIISAFGGNSKIP